MRAISASLVVADVPASPPPRSLIWPHKPHPQWSAYFLDRTLVICLALVLWGVPAGVLRAQQPEAPTHPQHQQTPAVLEAKAAGSIEIEDLLRRATEHNPVLKQAEASIRIARARQKQAGLYPNPTIGYTADEVARGDVIRGGEHGFFVEQTVVTGGKLGKSRALEGRAAEQLEAAAEGQRLRITNTIRRLVYEVLAAQRRQELRQELAGLADEAVRTSYGLFNVGQADQPDVLEAEIEAHQLRLDLEAGSNELPRIWKELAAATGDPDLVPVPLAGELLAAIPTIEAASTLAKILEESPEVKITRAGIERSQANLQVTRSRRVPDIVIRSGLRYNRELLETAGQPVGWEGFADLGVRLPLFDRNREATEAAEGQVTFAEQELRRVELSLRRRFAEEFFRYQTARRTMEVYRDELLPRAQEAYRLYSDKHKEMAAAYPQVLIAQRTLLQLNMRYVSALEDLWRSVVSLQGYLMTESESAGGVSLPAVVHRRETD